MIFNIQIIFSDLEKLHVQADASTKAEAWQAVLQSEEFAHIRAGRGISSYLIIPERTVRHEGPVYEIFKESGHLKIRRNKPPRFVGSIVFHPEPGIGRVEWIDPCEPSKMERLMRNADKVIKHRIMRNKE